MPSRSTADPPLGPQLRVGALGRRGDVKAAGLTLGPVKTVILDPLPAEIEALLERRKQLGQHLLDEVWEGVYHMTPGPSNAHAFVDEELAAVLRPYAQAAGLHGSGIFNLGEPDDYRVPDRGYHRSRSPGVRVDTAAIVVEIVSPGDETFDKFGFYAAHLVDEIVVADPAAKAVRFFERDGGGYRETSRSSLLGVDASTVTAAISWPSL